MDINDNNPERRNLVVLSLVIITFYLGNASLSNDRLKLPFIEITFHNTCALIWIVWITLFWFAFRYWVQHKERFAKEFKEEITGQRHNWWFFAKCYIDGIEPPTAAELDRRLTDFINNTEEGKTLLRIRFREKREGAYAYEGKPLNEIDIKGFWAGIWVMCLALRIFFSKPSMSANIAPFLLFIMAVILGLWECLNAANPHIGA